MQKKAPDQNRALDDALAALARRLDPARVVHRDSGTGDGHYYSGWYEGKLGDILTAETVPLVTEYGAAALPAVETLRTMFDASTLWPETPAAWEAWQFADFQPKMTFEIAKIERGGDIHAFVNNTQRYQAITVRVTTEALRRRKWSERGKTTGVYQFMFVDDWPSITWSVVDYYRRPKLGYAALKGAMQPLLPSISYDPHNPGGPIGITIVNDYTSSFLQARVVWQLKEGEKVQLVEERRLDIPADGVVHVADLGVLSPFAKRAKNALLEVTVLRASGEVLARADLGFYDFLETVTK
jgi:beta-mannosidase